MDSADQRSVRVGPAEGKETTRRCTRRDSPGIQNGHSPSARSHPTSVCSFLIFVLSSLIRLSVPISRGTVTGQRNSRTRLRASCPTSRTSEHSRAGARRCDVRMFGCLSLDGPHREAHLDPEPKGAPRSIRIASVPPVSDVATLESVPDLAKPKRHLK